MLQICFFGDQVAVEKAERMADTAEARQFASLERERLAEEIRRLQRESATQQGREGSTYSST